jgi:hypothetical protein
MDYKNLLVKYLLFLRARGELFDCTQHGPSSVSFGLEWKEEEWAALIEAVEEAKKLEAELTNTTFLKRLNGDLAWVRSKRQELSIQSQKLNESLNYLEDRERSLREDLARYHSQSSTDSVDLNS